MIELFSGDDNDGNVDEDEVENDGEGVDKDIYDLD